jgi:AraC-like DNA-binding protein
MAASPIALVRSAVLAPIVRFLDQEGVPYEDLFEAAKLSPRLIERPDNLFPLAQGFALGEQIARVLGLDDVGLRAASHVAITDFGQLGDIVCGAATLSEALHSLIRGVTAFNTVERLSLEWRRERLFLSHRFAIRPVPGQRYADSYSVVVMMKAVQLALGSEWKPELILLPESERVRKRQYEAFFKTDIWFESETWAISVPPSRLTDPIRKTELRGDARQETRSVPPSPARDLIGSLREMIRPSLQRAYPDIGHAAALAGVSVSTLQRRLRESGITYSELVETERLRFSIELLARGDIKISDVASELGYTEPANFIRAFRKWTGLTPSQFRTHQLKSVEAGRAVVPESACAYPGS